MKRTIILILLFIITSSYKEKKEDIFDYTKELNEIRTNLSEAKTELQEASLKIEIKKQAEKHVKRNK